MSTSALPERAISRGTVQLEAHPNYDSIPGLAELLLKDQRKLDLLSRSADAQRKLIPRLLAVALIGYAAFGVALSLCFSAAQMWPELSPISEWLQNQSIPPIHFTTSTKNSLLDCWLRGSAFSLTAAFCLGLIGAVGVCLPSFYFFALLAGVRTNMLQVTTFALKGTASGAVALLGAVPIYFAIILGLVVCEAPYGLVKPVCLLGLILPFVAGLWGTRSLYIGFLGLTDTIAADERCRRTTFLSRLLASWSVCYTAVTPVMIHTLWHLMDG